MDEVEVELFALRELGLAGPFAHVAPPPGSAPLDTLLQRGLAKRHQALAVRAWIAHHVGSCSCGARARRGGPCPACGQPLAPAGGRRRPPLDVRPGARLGPFQLQELLGRGASGAVYRARHTDLGREVALKVIGGSPGLDARRQQRFAREVEALARLDHPGIVRVHSALVVDDALLCELELVDGETLEDRVLSRGPLAWREAGGVLAKLARAVQYAHDRGVLHRDLKPANVLLRRDGSPVLADLGLARLEDQASSLTAAGALVGTPYFMAPEAFNGVATAGSDVYGLGGILYFALTGRAPFEVDSLPVLLAAVSRGTCAPTAAPGAPAALEVVRARSMAPELEQRYPSAQALAEDLERVLAGLAPAGSGWSSWSGLLPPRRRRLALRLALPALVAAALVAGALAGRSPPPPTSSRPPGSAGEAIELLARVDVPAPSRSAALGRLTAEVDRPAAVELAPALDAAVARAPGAWELRVARALLAGRRDAAVDAQDLAAVASHCQARIDGVVRQALERGLAGAAAFDVALSVRTIRPGSRLAGALVGVEACRRGDPALRDLARVALSDARAAEGRAGALLAGLTATDALVDALAASQRSLLEVSTSTALAPAEALLPRIRALAAGDLACALPVVLAPLEGAIRRAATTLLASRARLSVIDILDAARPCGSARLLCLAELLRDGELLSTAPAEPELLVRAGDALAATDPLLAAGALQGLARRTLYATQGGGPAEGQAARLEEWNRKALTALEGRVVPEEDYLLITLRRRALIDLATIAEQRARWARSEGDRQEWLQRALERGWAALDVAKLMQSGTHQSSDGTLVVRMLFALGREQDAGPILSLLGKHGPALRAELLRRDGDLEGALALLDAEAARTDEREERAVRAMVLADLGRAAEARASLRQLRELERRRPSEFEPLRSAAVAQVVER